MEVKPGYKRTEVGEIPEEWDLNPLEAYFTFKNGLNKAKRFFGFGTPIVNYMDVFQSSGLRIRDVTGCVDVNQKELSAYEVHQGDVFFTRTSETVDEIGIASVMLDKTVATVFSGFILRARPINQGLDNQFKRYCFAARYFRQQVIARASYTTRALTNGRSLSAALLAQPPIREQRAIAAALSDVDALLGGLDRLVAKRRDLKQAVMQQLLTGQTRLPGFDRAWRTETIGSIVQTPVTDGPHLTPRFLTDGVPFLSVNNLVENKIDLTDLRFISKEDDKEFSKKCKPRRGDVLLGKAASVGKVAIVDTDLDFNIWSPIAMIRVGDANSSRFVYYQLQSLDLAKQIVLLTNSSSQGNIGMSDIEKLTLQLPPLEEQVAIATFLADMDLELTALEARREKTLALKQAMMQELLTGRTRLLTPEVTPCLNKPVPNDVRRIA